MEYDENKWDHPADAIFGLYVWFELLLKCSFIGKHCIYASRFNKLLNFREADHSDRKTRYKTFDHSFFFYGSSLSYLFPLLAGISYIEYHIVHNVLSNFEYPPPIFAWPLANLLNMSANVSLFGGRTALPIILILVKTVITNAVNSQQIS